MTKRRQAQRWWVKRMTQPPKLKQREVKPKKWKNVDRLQRYLKAKRS